MSTVLVVDDDAPILRMLERTLAADGYQVEAAADGGSALAAIEQAVPDLVMLDVASRRAQRAGRALELSAREADLLELLLRNPEQVVTRELALDRVWGGRSLATLNAVDRYVSYLRRKLGEPQLIQTVRGVGFVLSR